MIPDDSRFLRIAAYVIHRHEGGDSDHSADAGGKTRYGISKAVYPAEFAGRLVPNLQRAVEIYWRDYWTPLGCSNIQSDSVAAKAFDMAVNMGGSRAGRILQQATNQLRDEQLKVDGQVGSVTLRAVNMTRHPDALVAVMCGLQWAFYQALIERNQTQRDFAAGWARRSAWHGVT